MSVLKTTAGYTLEDIVKSVIAVLQTEQVESKESYVPETVVKTYKGFEDYPDILQAKHVRAILGLSEAKTYEVLNSKKCPSFTVGKRKLVSKKAFIEFLESSKREDLID